MSMPPMPDDSLERISIHSASPVSPRGHMIPSPIRTDTLEVPGRKRAPTIGFSEDVTNHHYPRIGQPGTATHEHEHIHGEDPTTPRAPKARSGSSDSNVWDAYYRESYIDPYATSDRSAGGQVTSPTLTSMLKASLNAPSADLSVQDPRSTRSRSQNRTASSRIGQWGELFSPSKRSMREERDREETEELVRSPGGHARNESKDSKATDESEDDFDRRSVTSADAV